MKDSVNYVYKTHTTNIKVNEGEWCKTRDKAAGKMYCKTKKKG